MATTDIKLIPIIGGSAVSVDAKDYWNAIALGRTSSPDNTINIKGIQYQLNSVEIVSQGGQLFLSQTQV